MNQPDIKLAENVIIIDAAFYNFITSDMKKYFEERLNRKLQDIDITRFATDIALDAGVQCGNNSIQLLWVYNDQAVKLSNSVPSDLSTELNGVAFKSEYGEFSFAGVPCSDMVTREELFMDLLNITADSADVKRIVLIPYGQEYGAKVEKAITKIKEKDLVLFWMNQPQNMNGYRLENLMFPMLHAFNIRPDEF